MTEMDRATPVVCRALLCHAFGLLFQRLKLWVIEARQEHRFTKENVLVRHADSAEAIHEVVTEVLKVKHAFFPPHLVPPPVKEIADGVSELLKQLIDLGVTPLRQAEEQNETPVEKEKLLDAVGQIVEEIIQQAEEFHARALKTLAEACDGVNPPDPPPADDPGDTPADAPDHAQGGDTEEPPQDPPAPAELAVQVPILPDQKATTSAVIISVDLAEYGRMSRDVQELLNVEQLLTFNDEIRSTIDASLEHAQCDPGLTMVVGTGDGALIFMWEQEHCADRAVRFAIHLQEQLKTTEQTKKKEDNKRFLRVGIASGALAIRGGPSPSEINTFQVAGISIALAVRLEALCPTGGVALFHDTWGELDDKELRDRFQGSYAKVQGKDHETDPIEANFTQVCEPSSRDKRTWPPKPPQPPAAEGSDGT